MQVTDATATERLELFLKRAHELERLRFYPKRNDWQVVCTAPYESTFPDDEELRSFLLSLRHFFLKRDPVYLDEIWSLALERLDDPELKAWALKNCERTRCAREGLFRYTIAAKEYGPYDVFDIYINAGLFHNDPDKLKFWAGLTPFMASCWKASVHQFIDAAVGEIDYLKAVVHVVLDPTLQ